MPDAYLISEKLKKRQDFMMSAYCTFEQPIDFQLLKKSYLTLEYTFYNVTTKRPENIMKIDLLREAGIGDLLVDIGRLTEGKKQELEARFEYENY